MEGWVKKETDLGGGKYYLSLVRDLEKETVGGLKKEFPMLNNSSSRDEMGGGNEGSVSAQKKTSREPWPP